MAGAGDSVKADKNGFIAVVLRYAYGLNCCWMASREVEEGLMIVFRLLVAMRGP